MAHQYLRNMLDQNMTVNGETETMGYKRELTQEDLDLLIKNCGLLYTAAIHAKQILEER